MRILLVEPNYKNKYPPLGLMKISTFHKQRNDEVFFTKGLNKELSLMNWDRVYISSLFTFHWNITTETIKYYYSCTSNSKDIFIGGVMATLLKEKIKEQFSITIITGLLNQPGKLLLDHDEIIDNLTPDYSIIDNTKNPYLNYDYPVKDCYFAYSTRGCIRKCSFCAVPIIEPKFHNSLSIFEQVLNIKNTFGEKRDLLLMDNNILASSNFSKIVDEIKALGYIKGGYFTYIKDGKCYSKKKYVDFNQGIDARLLTEEKIQLLSQISVMPLRIAFDDIKDESIYKEKVRMAASYGIPVLSNYILFNYKDSPEDFYRRLQINIELNDEFKLNNYKTRIWSFPMKYTPVTGVESLNRKYIGEKWNNVFLRSIQCILIVTHGVVGPSKDFFKKAFGANYTEFKEILLLPDILIINRSQYESTSLKLTSLIKNLSEDEKIKYISSIKKYNYDKLEKILKT